MNADNIANEAPELSSPDDPNNKPRGGETATLTDSMETDTSDSPILDNNPLEGGPPRNAGKVETDTAELSPVVKFFTGRSCTPPPDRYTIDTLRQCVPFWIWTLRHCLAGSHTACLSAMHFCYLWYSEEVCSEITYIDVTRLEQNCQTSSSYGRFVVLLFIAVGRVWAKRMV